MFSFEASSFLVLTAIHRNILHLKLVTVWFTLLELILLALCTLIQYDLNKFQNAVNELLWSDSVKRCALGSRNLKINELDFVHWEWNFDCGYFEIDLSLMPTLVDLTTLLAFAMLP